MSNSNNIICKSNIDIVFCIDGSGSMISHIDVAKNYVRNFYKMLDMEYPNYTYRIRVIIFRDYNCDIKNTMQKSEFFKLPQDEPKIEEYLDNITIIGGGDAKENGLEALYFAMTSDFINEKNDKQIIILFTDADAHELGKFKHVTGYPEDISTLKELEEIWNGVSVDETLSLGTNKHLFLFAPTGSLYESLKDTFENCVFEPIDDDNPDIIDLKKIFNES